jgi:spore maturation protein CgeB
VTSVMLLMENYGDSYSNAIEGDPLTRALPYAEMAAAAWDQAIYYGDAYVEAMHAAGLAAEQVVPLCRPLQYAWAAENGIRTPPLWLDRRPFRWPWTRRGRGKPSDAALSRIVDVQVEAFQPDVLWVFSGVPVTRRDIARWRRSCGKVVLWWSCALRDDVPYDAFDLILTGFPPWVDEFRRRNVRAEYLPHAFDARMASLSVPSWDRRSPSVAFVGNLSSAHHERISFLEAVSRQVDMDFYGAGIEHLPDGSPLRSRYRGAAWGRDMYAIYGRHALVLEVSGDLPGRWSFSKRLFESTGMGACLVTEETTNLPDLFTPGEEVATYTDLRSCVETIGELTSHPARASEIAMAGQRRTHTSHTYDARVADLINLLSLEPADGATPQSA